ncbi:MAG: V-type ATP synthase subunit E family protein, partial [Oscillospiraceae bacterium]
QSDIIKKQNQRKIAKSAIEAKHSLLIKRNDVTNSIFENIKTRLVDFVKTSNYDSYLLSTIEAFTKKNKIDNVQIILRKNDMKLQNEVKKAYGLNCEIIENDDIKIGGFIVQNKENRIYFDETLEQKLADEKDNFIQTSKFSL